MLRDYQSAEYTAVRAQTITHDAVLAQLATGGGKTPIVSEITKSAYLKGRRVWFAAPRNELVGQASAHFTKWGVPHGIIAAGCEESRAYMVHVVSKDTLLRRLDRIKNWPDLLVFDECHIALDAQIKIIAAAALARAALGLPPMKIIGMTATPERLDGRGLSEVYESIVYGPSIPWLTDRGFLSQLRYFAPPIEGLDKIHRKGTEYDADELEALLEKRKVYGDVIGYYEKYGTVKHTSISLPGQAVIRTNENYAKGKPALIFCRSVKSAYETAERFCKAGFNFHCIEGNLPPAELKTLIKALRDGKIDGLTNCDIATYGLDIPRIEYGASIRPTLSRALYFQKVGRILRPYEDAATGYKKEEALFFDHANLVQEHQLPEFPGIPLFYLDQIDWNFNGREKRAKAKADPTGLRLCPHLDYQYCEKPSCSGCPLKDPAEIDARKSGLEVVDAKLEERHAPLHFSDLQPEEKRDVQDRIGRATDAVMGGMSVFEELPALGKHPKPEEILAREAEFKRLLSGPVGELLKIAAELGRSPMWVYFWLTEKENAKRNAEGKPERKTVNVTLVHEIGRQCGYKSGWSWFKIKELRAGRKEEAVV